MAALAEDVSRGSRAVRLGESIPRPGCLRSLPNAWMGPRSRGGLPLGRGSALARGIVQLRDQKRMRIRGHGTACNNTWPQVDGRSAHECWAQGHNLVIQVLPPAAAERPAGHAWVALAVVADAPQVAPRRIGEEDVGPQVDGLRRPLEASPGVG
jgi:hypothetical protein